MPSAASDVSSSSSPYSSSVVSSSSSSSSSSSPSRRSAKVLSRDFLFTSATPISCASSSSAAMEPTSSVRGWISSGWKPTRSKAETSEAASTAFAVTSSAAAFDPLEQFRRVVEFGQQSRIAR